ncbi:MAG: uracil-DNA glycosylase [bacterium]
MNREHHSSFDNFFTKEINDLLDKIELEIGSDYTPNSDLILRVLNNDLSKVKVIWLGQDPYFQEGVATGRSFEPADVTSWFDKYRQVSLKNIIRGIYKAYNDEFLTYTEILKLIAYNQFELKEPKEWFDSLEQQGVMFLNTYLTCIVNNANAHRKVWKEFSKKLFEYIYNYNKDISWFLWGNEAKSILDIVPVKNYSSNHPMMCSNKNKEDFQFNNCFKDTKDIINWLG